MTNCQRIFKVGVPAPPTADGVRERGDSCTCERLVRSVFCSVLLVVNSGKQWRGVMALIFLYDVS